MGYEMYHLDETGMHMKKIKRTSGFSMVEVLVASAFVSVLAVTGLTSYTYMRNLRNRSTDICRVHVSGVVEKFRSIGYFSAINTFSPLSSDRAFPGNTPTSLRNSKGIPNEQLWPTTLSVLEAAPRPTLNNSVLISSSINALLAIYNTNAEFCTNSNGAVYTGAAVDPTLVTLPSADLKSASIRLQIVPYDINTGSPLSPACPMPLRIAPESAGGSSSAFGTSPPKAKGGNTKYNTGLLVRVIEDYTNEDGKPSSCSIEQRFQYSPDLTPPRPPNFSAMNPSGVVAGSGSCGTSPNTNVVVTFGYDGYEVIEPGAVMVCRDNSIVDDTPAPGYTKFQCRSGPVPQVIARDFPAPGLLPAGQTGLTYSASGAGYAARNTDPNNEWMPCDRVTACGIPPTNATLLGTNTSTQPKYALTYNGLPLGCRVNIEVAAIDTASNSSSNYLTAGTGPDNINPDLSMTRIQFDVARPYCGATMCGSCGANCGLSPGQVYFQCPSCP